MATEIQGYDLISWLAKQGYTTSLKPAYTLANGENNASVLQTVNHRDFEQCLTLKIDKMSNSEKTDGKTSFSQKDIRSYVMRNYTPVHSDESSEVFYSCTQKAYISFQFTKENYTAKELVELFSQSGTNFDPELEYAYFRVFVSEK